MRMSICISESENGNAAGNTASMNLDEVRPLSLSTLLPSAYPVCFSPSFCRTTWQETQWTPLELQPQGNLSDLGMEPASLVSPALAYGFFTTTATRETLALDGWDVYQRSNFTKPRLLQLLIHGKVVNSLTWDVCFIACLFSFYWHLIFYYLGFFFPRNHYISYFSLKQSSEKL